jgi:hypothetical protein
LVQHELNNRRKKVPVDGAGNVYIFNQMALLVLRDQQERTICNLKYLWNS